MGLLDGKVAIVTGAGGGIGREHAQALAAEGARVLVNDLGGARDGSGKGSQRMADHSVSSMAGGRNILNSALAAFGKVDILVNNAGILRDKTLSKMEEEQWDTVNAVHLKGTFCVTQPVFNHMRERGEGGVIVNTSSTSGLEGNFGQCNYGAAKAGIWGFSRCLALEGKKNNIRVFVLAPVAHTRLTEDLPFFQVEETKARMDPKLVSPLVVFLVSDLAKDLTGRTFFVGGGTIAEMKMVRGEGATKKEDGGLWTPREIARSIDKILA